MIKLKGWHTTHIEVELQQSDTVDAVINVIRKRFKLTNVDYIDDKGQMFESVEYATSHSWIKEEPRGKASAEQKQALEVIKFLKTVRWEKDDE